MTTQIVNQILQSDATWLLLSNLAVWFANSYLTTHAQSWAPTSRKRRAIRWLVGVLNKIDQPEVAKE